MVAGVWGVPPNDIPWAFEHVKDLVILGDFPCLRAEDACFPTAMSGYTVSHSLELVDGLISWGIGLGPKNLLMGWQLLDNGNEPLS